MSREKLSKSFPPPIEYIDKIPNVVVDIELILHESIALQNLNWIDGPIQKKLCVYRDNRWEDFTKGMSYTQTLVNSLKDYMPYNQVYYRYVKPNTCYNWHIDYMKTCLHIPLITNIGCKFIYENTMFNMPADGSVYIVNNSIYHTFINAGSKDRLHITMDIF
jgi:hypothetical protein